MNLVIQLGHLARDPELRTTKSGTPVLNCSICTNRSVPRDNGSRFEDVPTFIEFTIWGPRAEAFNRFHEKGSRAFLVGRLENDEWTDRNSGQKRTRTKMIAEQWEFVSDKGERTGRTSGEPAYDGPEVDDTPF